MKVGMIVALLLVVSGVAEGISIASYIASGNPRTLIDTPYDGVITEKLERFLVDSDGTRVFWYLRVDTIDGPFDIQVNEQQFLRYEVGDEFSFVYRTGDTSGVLLTMGGIAYTIIAVFVGGIHIIGERRHARDTKKATG